MADWQGTKEGYAVREIKDGDTVYVNDLSHLEKVDFTMNLVLDDVVTWGSHAFYGEVKSVMKRNESTINYFTKYAKDGTLYRVPRHDEQEKEPEVGEMIDISHSKVGWIIEYVEESYKDKDLFDPEDEDNEETVKEINDDRIIFESNSFELRNSKARVLLISKGDEEILEAACSSGEPEEGDKVLIKDCKVGWKIREINNSKYNDVITIAHFMNHAAWFKERETGLINEAEVKLVSKGSPQPGDIVELRDCQVGWTVDLNMAGVRRNLIIEEIKKNTAWFTEGAARRLDYKVKLISKGSEGQSPEDNTDEGTITDDLATFRKNGKSTLRHIKQQNMSTQDFQEHMGRPGEVVEEDNQEEVRVRHQYFNLPDELLTEIMLAVKGMPSDVKVTSADYDTIQADSTEFMDQADFLDIIPDGKGGWKVEGT